MATSAPGQLKPGAFARKQACANVEPKRKGAGALGGDAGAHLHHDAGLSQDGRGGRVDLPALVKADAKLGRRRESDSP